MLIPGQNIHLISRKGGHLPGIRDLLLFSPCMATSWVFSVMAAVQCHGARGGDFYYADALEQGYPLALQSCGVRSALRGMWVLGFHGNFYFSQAGLHHRSAEDCSAGDQECFFFVFKCFNVFI